MSLLVLFLVFILLLHHFMGRVNFSRILCMLSNAYIRYFLCRDCGFLNVVGVIRELLQLADNHEGYFTEDNVVCLHAPLHTACLWGLAKKYVR